MTPSPLPTLLSVPAPAPAAPAGPRPADGPRADGPAAPGSFQRWLAQSQERAQRERLAAQRAADSPPAAAPRARTAAAVDAADPDGTPTRAAKPVRDQDTPDGTSAASPDADRYAAVEAPGSEATKRGAAGRDGAQPGHAADPSDDAEPGPQGARARGALLALGSDGVARGRATDAARAARTAAQRAGEGGKDESPGTAAAGRDFADLLAGATAADAPGRAGLPGGPATTPGPGTERATAGTHGGAGDSGSLPLGAESAAGATVAAAASPQGPGDAPATPPPPAEAYLPQRPDQPSFAPALGAQVSLWVRDGVQEARLHLNPPEMGPVTVHIALDGASARVEFAAGAAATRSAIEHSLPDLASALRDSGLTLAGGGVFDQPRGRDDTPPDARRPGGLAADDNAPAAAVAAPAPTMRPRGLVDLMA